MITKDDRNDEQKKTHRWAVVARDSFLSGWGHAQGGASRCAWACAPDANIDRLENWVRSRSDMKYVNVVNLDNYRPARGTAHFHIYVCNKDHTSQK